MLRLFRFFCVCVVVSCLKPQQSVVVKYKGSLVKPIVSRVMSFGGVQGATTKTLSAGLLAVSTVAIGVDAVSPAAGLARPGWGEFCRVAGLWLGMNTGLLFLLGCCNARLWRVDGTAKRFERYPLFTWLCPAVQQVCFFIPALCYTSWAVLTGRPLRSFGIHCVAGLVGMQLRDLLYLGYDFLMTAHHVLSIFIASVAFHGLRRYDDPTWLASAAIAIAAMEAGSLGTNLWAFYGSRAAFFSLITASHVVALVAGAVGVYARHPKVPEFWILLLAGLPLVVQRQLYMQAEVRKGKPSGEFDS